MRNELREGRYLTSRLYRKQFKLLSELGRTKPDFTDRYMSLKELATTVDQLKIKDIRKRKLKALRLKIPPELEKAIAKKMKQTGQPFIRILLKAAKKYESIKY